MLGDVQRRKAADYLPNDPNLTFAFKIRSIEMFTLSDSMFINADTLASLQILGSETHPDHVNQRSDKSKSGSKESLSVYGLFHVLAHTSQGKSKLRQIFLRPSLDLDLIHERQRTISMFLRPDNCASVGLICKRLRKIKNIKNHLMQLKKGAGLAGGHSTIDRGTWTTLQAFSAYSIELRETICRLQGAEGLMIRSRVST